MNARTCGTSNFGGSMRCANNAVAVRTTACVHEHLRDEAMCPDHLQDLEQGVMACEPCYDLGGGLGHECKLRAVADVDLETGERRVLPR